MKQIPHQPNETPTLVFNPDSSDYRFIYNGQLECIIRAFDYIKLPKYQADLAASHMADLLFQKKGRQVNYEEDKKAYLEEILPKL